MQYFKIGHYTIFLFLQINYMYSSSYLYSNSNQEACEQFQKPSAILRPILFVMETTKTQQLLLFLYDYNSNLVRLERLVILF